MGQMGSLEDGEAESRQSQVQEAKSLEVAQCWKGALGNSQEGKSWNSWLP